MAKKEPIEFVCASKDHYNVSIGGSVQESYEHYCEQYDNDPVDALDFYSCTKINVKQSIEIVLTEKE